MAASLTNTAQYVDFFQQTILRGLRYWQEHAAVQQIDVPVLDRERETVLDVLTRGMDFDPAWPSAKALITAFASYMERRGHWEAWRQLLERAITTAQRVDDVDGETTMTALLARLSQRQSRPQDVVKYYRRVIGLAKRNDNRFEEARACSNLGYACIDGGRWWRAEILCLHALSIFDELGNEHGLAHTHNHLGLLYSNQGQWDLAESNLKSACRIWEENRDQHSLIYGLSNLGQLYVRMNNPEFALRFLAEAEQIARNTGESSSVAIIWNNIASAYRLNLEWNRAYAYAKKAEAKFRQNNNFTELANVLNNLGLIAHGCKNDADALRYLEESLRIHSSLDNHSGIGSVLQDMKRVAT